MQRAVTFLAPNMLPVYQAVVDYLGERLGFETQLVIGSSDYREVHEADICFICGLPYVEYTAPRYQPALIEAVAAPVLQGERYQNKPLYFSDVIVRNDSPFQTFADLRRCVWGFNEPRSQSGYGITRYTLVQRGETRGFFGRVVEVGYHQIAFRKVCRGEIDAAAIDSQVLALELREHPDLAAQLRIIDAFGPSTIQPVAVAAHLPASLKADIQQALVSMHEHTAMRSHLDYGLIDHFVAVDDGAYDDIRAMLAACEKAGFMTVR